MSTSNISNEVILVGEDKQVTQCSSSIAKSMADEAGLDLIEIARTNGKSVCKIMDKGKWLYEQKKAQKLKKQHIVETKEIRIRPHIDDRDVDIKVNRIKEFLIKKHNVKVTIFMKGREKSYRDIAHLKLIQVLERIGDVKKDDVKHDNNNISVLIRAT
jgi:translation initiation factor IF-3